MDDQAVRRLSALSYYLMLFIGVIFSLAGVTNKAIAEYFSVDPAFIGYRFTLFSVGYSLSILGNGFVLNRIDLRKETLSALCLVSIAAFGATVGQSTGSFSFFIFLYGFGLGIICSVANYMIVGLFESSQRTGKLNLLNFFFSIGAIVAPMLAGLALGHGVKWQSVFQATLFLAVGGWYFAYRQKFTINSNRQKTLPGDDGETWNIGVYLIALALLSYVVSEMTFTYWIVLYMMDIHSLTVALASISLSAFWFFMAIGRLLAGFFVNKFLLMPFIVFCSLAAFTAYFGVLTVKSAIVSFALVSLMGLFYSSLYASILSYGTMQLSHHSAKLTTFYLTIGAAGGILSFLLSSYLKTWFGIVVVLSVSAGLMAIVTFSCAFCGLLTRRKKL